jgi:hypothetical protein
MRTRNTRRKAASGRFPSCHVEVFQENVNSQATNESHADP